MNKIKAYEEMLSVIREHSELTKKDNRIDIADVLEDRIRLLKISDEFNIDLDINQDSSYIHIDSYRAICMFGKAFNRTIAWSDDDRQPENERLYVINFPTGAYIFGDSYPQETFNMFFNDLKSYRPKYTDSPNKGLYYTSETAKDVHENFKSIFDKHAVLVADEVKRQKISKLEEELLSLKGPASDE